MKHKRNRQLKRVHRKYKHLAAAMAGAAILSSAALPGLPSATAHAAALPSGAAAAGAPPVENSLQVEVDTQRSPVVRLDPALKDAPVQTPEAMQKNPNMDTVVNHKGPANYEKVLDIKATAYAPGAHDNGKWGNKTHIGTNVRPGIIAVDPRVIPLGSSVYIAYPDGHGEYAVAEDTGGAIKGHRIDVAKWTVSEAEDFGIQHVKVYVLDSPDNYLAKK